MSTLGPYELQQLVDRFLACQSIEDKAARGIILGMLPQHIRNSIDEHSQNRVHVTNIVKQCLNHQDVFDVLIEAVRYFEKASFQMQALDEEIEKLFHQTIPRAQVAYLCQLMVHVTLTDNDLRRFYKKVAPQGGLKWQYPQGNGDRDTLYKILRQLAKARIQKPANTHPLVEFIEELVAVNEPSVQEVRDDLYTWIEDAVEALGIHSRQHAEQFDISPKVYLMVQLRPKQPLTDKTELTKAKFYVEAWFIYSGGERPLRNFDEEKEYLLKDIPGIVQDLVQQSSRELFDVFPGNYELTIEFFLPFELLLYEVDHWQIKLGLRSMTRIGSKHPVVVRSLERVTPTYIKDLWKDWYTRWRRFEQLQRQFHEGAIVQVCDYDTCRLLSIDSFHEDIVGFVQSFIPSSNEESLTSILVAIIDSGIPVALLPRPQNIISEQHRTSLEQVIKECLSSDLPSAICEVRRRASETGEQTHAGHYLTLLWDDPNRLPPTARALFPGIK